MTEFLVKYGEISLKGANRMAFEKRLMRNIARRLPRGAARVRRTWGRVFLAVEDAHADEAARILAASFGVVSYARVARFAKTEAAFPQAADFLAGELAAGRGQSSFKIEASREDKQFSLDSYGIACLLGDLLRARLPGITVDVRRPDATVRVERHAYFGANDGAHLLCHLGRRRPARADGPDRFVGDDDAVCLLRLNARQSRRHLTPHDGLRAARVALVHRFSDAQDGHQTCREHCVDLGVDEGVRLAEELPTLRVTDDDVRAQTGQHPQRDLACECALRLGVGVLRTDSDAGAR